MVQTVLCLATMSNWFYAVNQNKTKVSESELVDMIRAGQLHGGNLVWTDGMDQWQPICQSQFTEVLEETEVCALSGTILQRTEMLQYGNFWIAPDQKHRLVDSLMQVGRAPVQFRLAAPVYSSINSYRSIDVTGKFAKWLILFSSGLLAIDILGIYVASTFQYFEFIGFFFLLNCIVFLLAIPMVILYCLWKARCVGNCKTAGETPKKAEMMIASYFIPILNLWMPYLCMKSLWRATAGKEDQGKQIAIVDFWWAIWMAAMLFFGLGCIGLLSRIMSVGVGMFMLLIAGVLNVIAAVLIFRIIGIISRKQEERFCKME